MSLLGIVVVLLLVLAVLGAVFYWYRGRNPSTTDGYNGVAPILPGTVVDSQGHETVPGLDNSEGVLNTDPVNKV